MRAGDARVWLRTHPSMPSLNGPKRITVSAGGESVSYTREGAPDDEVYSLSVSTP